MDCTNGCAGGLRGDREHGREHRRRRQWSAPSGRPAKRPGQGQINSVLRKLSFPSKQDIRHEICHSILLFTQESENGGSSDDLCVDNGSNTGSTGIRFPHMLQSHFMFRTAKLRHIRSIAAGPLSEISWWKPSLHLILYHLLSISSVVFYCCIAVFFCIP